MNTVWSAAPTPFDDELRLDVASLERMVEHHLRLGVEGLFLCGTCGEGPWMTDLLRTELVKRTRALARGRLAIAVQVTDNSAGRVLDNIARMRDAGAEVAIVAAPFFHKNPSDENLTQYYLDTLDRSPLPIGLYDLGKHAPVKVPFSVLLEAAAHERTVLVKDSSCNPERARQYISVRDERSGLSLLNGYEFDLPAYARLGYDGALLGGAVFNGFLAGKILSAASRNDYEEAERLQTRMNRMMHRVFGGESCACWLTGQKQLLVEMGLFSTSRSLLNFPLTKECLAGIRAVVREERDLLFPTIESECETAVERGR